MPYIIQAKRDDLNPAIEELVGVLRGLESDDPDHNDTEGNINYIFSTILAKVYPGNRYAEINSAMGIVSSVQSEYYRRVAVPYEAQKAFDNGDVFTS